MSRWPYIITLLFIAIAASTTCLAQQSAVHLRRSITKTVEGDYLLYLPKGYEQGDDRWPLLLFLHGAGERGSDLELVKKHGPPMLIEEGREFPFIVVSPQVPEGRRVYPMAGHDSWTETYANPEFYEWLLNHRLPN